MLRVKVFPPKDFLYGFLSTKGFLLVGDKPQILHYIGSDLKELRNLLKEDKPDLLINHSFSSFQLKNICQVYHPLQSQKDLLQVKKIWTNSFRLCKFYYERIGLQAEIKIIPSEKPKRVETGTRLPSFAGYIRNMVDDHWRAFKAFMYWE